MEKVERPVDHEITTATHLHEKHRLEIIGPVNVSSWLTVPHRLNNILNRSIDVKFKTELHRDEVNYF